MEDINIEKTKKIIARQLLKLRTKKRKTQEQVSKEIGQEKLDVRSYKSYESGIEKHFPSLEKLILLANYFNVTVDTLLTGHTYTDDSSYTWESNFKRLGRLVLSGLLGVYEKKEEDRKANKNESSYYLLPQLEEVDIYLDRIIETCKTKNFLVKIGKYDFKDFSIDQFDSQIKEFKEMKEIIHPHSKDFRFDFKKGSTEKYKQLATNFLEKLK